MEDSLSTWRRKRFLLSSLSPDEKQCLGSYIKQLGGTFLDRQVFTKQATHVVCGKPNRGEKYLAACVSGRWVLKRQFIEDSFKSGHWHHEEDYEWKSEDLGPDCPLALVSLYDAPRKWRIALKNKKGAFENWNVIVHIQDNKMKKAYERLLEAGSATICKKKPPFQDKNVVKEMSHVFVENSFKPDVKCFETNGVPCISPDYIPEYIIQVSKEQVVNSFNIKERNRNVINTIKLPKKSASKKPKRVLPGKENGPNSTDGAQVVNKKGTKRAATDCDLCAAKRQKTMDEVFPYCQSKTPRKAVNVENSRKLVFPSYASSLVESYVDEGCTVYALDSILSSLSRKHMPSSGCLQMIMNQFLLKSPSKPQAMKSYHVLQEIISLHAPASCQVLYLKALEEPKEDGSSEADAPTSWHFVSKVIRCSLEETLTHGDLDRMQENAELLLLFLDNLFKQDASGTSPHQTAIILRILCPSEAGTTRGKTIIKEFVQMCHKCVRSAIKDKTKLVVCQVLLDWLSLTITVKKQDDTSRQDCEFLAQEMFMALTKSNCRETTKLFLQCCHSSWLKMKTAELILANYDRRLIPQEYKALVNKTLSLHKIVFCHFFLLPRTKTNLNSKSGNSMHTNQNRKVNTSEKILTSPQRINSLPHDALLDKNINGAKVKLRKNAKGETPLHVACIHNDVAKVEELLQQNIDVNITDNAGWTALHEASNHGNDRCVEKILKYNEMTNEVNLLATNPDGITVLHDAVVNNHLAVVKLLTEAGGMKLFEAKTSSGETAVDLARTKEMTGLLESEMNILKQQDNHQHHQWKHATSPQPPAEEYQKVLWENKSRKVVAMNDCEHYLFLVSQLLQGYIEEKDLVSNINRGFKICQTCTADLSCWKNLSQHVDSIETHVRQLAAPQELSAICQLYISMMKLCNNSF